MQLAGRRRSRSFSAYTSKLDHTDVLHQTDGILQTLPIHALLLACNPQARDIALRLFENLPILMLHKVDGLQFFGQNCLHMIM